MGAGRGRQCVARPGLGSWWRHTAAAASTGDCQHWAGDTPSSSVLLSCTMLGPALLLLALATPALTSQQHRVRMVQARSCYYTAHNRELVCQCREDSTYLHLTLSEFLTARQEVSQ